MEPAPATLRHSYFMRLPMELPLAVVCGALTVACLAQAQAGDSTLRIPPVKTSLNIEGQPVEITAWGAISPAPSGLFRLAMTADLGSLQENLTAVLAAQMNRSERCGERLSVQRATIVPSAPSAALTVSVHYERFACAKALGKEIVKRIAGGNGVVDVNLAPSIGDDGIALTAEVRKIDADGSLGELLRSGSLGDSMREKIAASIESAVRKSANLKSMLPAGTESVAAIRAIQFADGGSGRLWLTIDGEVRLSAEQLRDVAKMPATEKPFILAQPDNAMD